MTNDLPDRLTVAAATIRSEVDPTDEGDAEALVVADIFAAAADVFRLTDRRTRGAEVNVLLLHIVTLGKLLGMPAAGSGTPPEGGARDGA